MTHRSLVILTLALTAMSSHHAHGQDCAGAGGFQQGAEQFVEVQYRTIVRSKATIKTVTEAEVLWQPQAMLSNPACYDLSKTSLLYKATDDEEWTDSEEKARPAGKSTKWIVKNIKPCLTYTFKIRVVGKTPNVPESIFELPKVLGPADPEETIESTFTPEAPDNFSSKVGANSGTVSWSPSQCALKYEIGISEPGGDVSKSRTETVSGDDTRLNIGELKPCTRYDVTIFAVLGEKYSEDLTASFATKPRLDAIASLKPTFVTSLDSAAITWDAWASVSCIDQYEVTICQKATKTCQQPQRVTKLESMSVVNYQATDLQPCSAYTIKIQPIYQDTVIEPRVFEFKTQSPPAAGLSVETVSANSVSTSTMQVSWTSVQCAASYRVYQKATEDNTWQRVAETTQLEIPVSQITPCTKYNFAISAVLDSGEETEKSIGPEMISDLDENDPFEAPNLHINNGDRHADVSWGHADCIMSYLIKACQPAYSDCLEASVDPMTYLTGGDNDRTIHYKLNNLDPCTTYTLEIVPIITGKSFTARPQEFTTTNGTPQPPEGFKVTPTGKGGDSATLTWESVQCATGYKIYQKIGGDEGEAPVDLTTTTTQARQEVYKELIPCEAYHYAVSTLVAEQESVKTEWVQINIPPQLKDAPELKILNNENDNMTIKFVAPPANDKCSIVEYEISYSADGGANYHTKTMSLADLTASDDIVLSFVGASTPLSIVRGRVKYDGSNEWSPVVSTHRPGDHSAIKGLNGEGEGATIVPIVVGCLVAVVIVAVIAFFLVRRRRNRDLYDAEKAETNGKKLNGSATSEETQKLNVDTNHPDA